MANYETLKAAVQDVVKTNGAQEITGANLQITLLSIINSLGSGYQFMGVATPTTSPVTSDQRVFYIAGQAGTYINFNQIVVTGIAVLYYDTEWRMANVLSVDDVPVSGSDGLVKSGGVYDEFMNVLDMLRKNSASLFSMNGIEYGSLDAEGQVVEANSRLRTKDFIPFTVSDWIYITSLGNGWNYSIYCYDGEKNFIGYLPYQNTTGFYMLAKDNDLVSGFATTSYIKLVFMYQTGSTDISESVLKTFDLVFCRVGLPKDRQEKMSYIANFDDNIVIPQYEYINAAGEPKRMRLRSDKVLVEPNTSYKVQKVLSYNSDERCSIARYDENDNLLQDSSWIDSEAEIRTTNEAYIRLVYRYDTSSNTIPYNVIPPYIITKTGEAAFSAQLIAAKDTYFANGSIDSSGNVVANPIRLVSGLINVESTATINITCNSGFEVSFALYDANKTFIEWTLSYSSTRLNYVLGYNVGYIRLVVKTNPDGSILPAAINTSGLSVTSNVIGTGKLNKLRVGQWNCGLYNAGVTPYGIPNDELADKLMEVRNLVTQIGADILIINEDVEYIDRNQTLKAYDAVYSQFYPYYTKIGYYMTILSKFPISGKSLLSDAGEHRAFYIGNVNINGDVVRLCGVHFSPFSSADRIAEAEQMSSYMNGFDRCILVGDLNTSNDVTEADAEMKPFRDAGLTIGNRGYWGAKVTYPNGNYKIDNIITKGIHINNFNVIEETSVSDHYPIVSNISF